MCSRFVLNRIFERPSAPSAGAARNPGPPWIKPGADFSRQCPGLDKPWRHSLATGRCAWLGDLWQRTLAQHLCPPVGNVAMADSHRARSRIALVVSRVMHEDQRQVGDWISMTELHSRDPFDTAECDSIGHVNSVETFTWALGRHPRWHVKCLQLK